MTKAVVGKAMMNVAGTTFNGNQGKLWNLRKAMKAGKKAFLILKREPKNEKDANAVAVYAHIANDGKPNTVCKIGYVPAEKAEWMAPAMDAGKFVRVANFEVKGGGKANLGVTMTVVHKLYDREVAPAEAKTEAE